MYDTQRDASMRLGGTVIRLRDGKPVYILEAVTKNTLVYKRIKADGLDQGNEGERGRLDTGDFNLTPVPLGYINHNGSACYLQRIPARKYKQGLSVNTLNCNNRAIMTRDVICSGSLYRCIMDIYPNIETCFATREIMDIQSVAFSREWAIHFRGGKNLLMYKGNKIVGEINEDEEYELMDHYRYLTESLEGVLEK